MVHVPGARPSSAAGKAGDARPQRRVSQGRRHVRSVTFSIAIPLYNKALYIRSTVESALAQTFTDLEVIVVDDGSSDGGAELLAAITDPRLRVVRQANAGVSRARNRAIALARGEWVAFLDADDWLHPQFLASLVAAQKAYPQAEAVATRFFEFHDDHGAPPPMWQLSPGPLGFELITDLPARWMKGPSLMTSSVAVRTRRLRQMQPCFHPGESCGEDLDMLFRLAERTPIALVDAPLAAYRLNAQSSVTKQHGHGAPPFIERMRLRALSGSMTAAQKKSALWFIAQHKLDWARDALASGRRAEGLYWVLNAHRAALSRRWWLTAMMTLWPRTLVARYLAHVRANEPPAASSPTANSGLCLDSHPVAAMPKAAIWPAGGYRKSAARLLGAGSR